MEKPLKVKKKLGEFVATAISGNDILSSSLYVSGIAIIFAGFYAPIVLLIVSIVLYLYKSVYREVVEALPVNGGTYNALLNGTSKTIAATAGVMTILSYIATCVISAKSAVEYLLTFLDQLLKNSGIIIESGLSPIVIPLVIIILLVFSLLMTTGLKGSSRVAVGIFCFHIFTLFSFVIAGIIFISQAGFGNFVQNISYTQEIVAGHKGLIATLFIAFSASLLGISGFESSADFVEEQEKGVFRKTLKNMLVAVTIVNPIIAILILFILPIPIISNAKDSILAIGAMHSGGLFLEGWISINAFLVLCGAVLTSLVGFSGLVDRMTLDECLPSFLIKENKNGAHPRIIFAFFILCSSILIATHGNLLSLAGVYTIAFLNVMTLFAFSALILRSTRKDLKRSYQAPFLFIIIAALATLIGIVGNLFIDSDNFIYFLKYFIPTILLVILVLYKREVLKFSIKYLYFIKPLRHMLFHKYYKILSGKIYVFIHHTRNLHRVLQYIDINENACNVVLVHCKDGDIGEKEKIEKVIPILKSTGAFEQFNINFHYIDIPFGPHAIDALVKEHKIQRNKIFIGSIHDIHHFDYEELGGVRIIS